MSIKIIPREKVYFRDWVEKNGIEVEVRELESGKYSAWTAAIVNAAFVADTTGHGSSPDVALEMLEKNLARYSTLQMADGKQVPIPKFDKQTAASRDAMKYAEITIKELERASKEWPWPCSPFVWLHLDKIYGRPWVR